MATTKQADPTTPSYEEAREELIDVVRRLEQGGTPLAESLALWERAEALAGVCQDWLDGARSRLDAVLAGRGGQDEEDDGAGVVGDGEV